MLIPKNLKTDGHTLSVCLHRFFKSFHLVITVANIIESQSILAMPVTKNIQLYSQTSLVVIQSFFKSSHFLKNIPKAIQNHRQTLRARANSQVNLLALSQNFLCFIKFSQVLKQTPHIIQNFRVFPLSQNLALLLNFQTPRIVVIGFFKPIQILQSTPNIIKDFHIMRIIPSLCPFYQYAASLIIGQGFFGPLHMLQDCSHQTKYGGEHCMIFTEFLLGQTQCFGKTLQCLFMAIQDEKCISIF